MNARTPLEIVATSPAGEKSRFRTEARGLQYRSDVLGQRAYELPVHERPPSAQPMTILYTKRERSGLFAGTYKPEMQTRNLRISRPYRREGRSFVKLFSAAAFAGNNATITVINRTNGRRTRFRVNEKGAGTVEVPAGERHVLDVVVEYREAKLRSYGERSVYRLVTPRGTATKQGDRVKEFEPVRIEQLE